MLNELSQEQIALMPCVRDEWIAKLKNPLDRQKAIEGIRFIYGLAGLQKPDVLFVSSPMGGQYAANLFKNMASVGASVRASVWASVRDSVCAPVGASVRASVWASVWDSVGDSVGASAGASVWDSVWASVGASVWASVGDSVGASVRDSVWASVRASVVLKFYDFALYGSCSDYGWVSFYDYFTRIGVINHEKFNHFKSLIESGVYDMIQFDKLAIVCENPQFIKRNNNGRLHCTTGPAIGWADGYELYFINGRLMPESILKNRITREQFINEKNAEIKGGMYEILGQRGVMNLLGASVVDTKTIVHKNGDIETVELLKTSDTFPEIDNQPLAWVKMVCPSTGTNYLQGVEPHHTNALDAIASLSMFKPEEYSFDYRS